jgi:simple sugar transport system ATP-binding protein
MSTEDIPALRLDHIRKEFGAVVAVQDISLAVWPGEIVALVGDNGAGKSTVVKIVSGVHRPTSGSMELHGRPVHFNDASTARRHGVEVVYQDLALAEMQPVYMNMFLGRERVSGPLRRLDKRRMATETEAVLNDLDVRIPSVRATIRDLSGGQRQGVAIARATHWATSLILMDEPTAALGIAETARVEELMQQLRGRGRAIMLVSHNLDQVFRVADRIAVMRRGVHIGARYTRRTSQNEIVSMITGLQAADTTSAGQL